MELVVILVLAGFLLLFLETFLPGMIAGLAGACSILTGVVLAYSRHGTQAGHIVLVIVLGLTSVAGWAYVSFFPDSPMARRFISHKVVGEIGTERPELLQKTGTAHTTLRPAGTALIENQRIDVVSEGTFIEKGSAIRVVAVEGARVVVRRVA